MNKHEEQLNALMNKQTKLAENEKLIPWTIGNIVIDLLAIGSEITARNIIQSLKDRIVAGNPVHGDLDLDLIRLKAALALVERATGKYE